MPELLNHLPFPNFRYYSEDAAGREFGVIVLKGTYEIDPSGDLVLAEEQAPLVLTDRYHGEVNVSSLWHPSDLVPSKPRAEIIVNAVAWAPNGEATPSFTCGVRLSGAEGTLIDKQLRVTGRRFWAPQWRRRLEDADPPHRGPHEGGFRGWLLTEPEPVKSLPLRYEFTYGGTFEKGRDGEGRPIIDCDPRNPIGRGVIHAEWSDHARPQPAPQIEAAEDPVCEPYKSYTPQGFGPIPPAWEPRLPRAGTFDDRWEQSIWPHWPADYDFSFHQSAHPDLVAPRFLKSDDRIDLANLLPEHPLVSFKVPQPKPIVQFLSRDGRVERRDFNLDTCFIDIATRTLAEARVYLAWRVDFEPDVYTTAVLGIAPDDFLEEFKEMQRRAAS